MDKPQATPGKAPLVRERMRQMARERGPNVKLPTRDELCAEHGMSRVTMDGILSTLEAENIIFRRRGSGIYVSPKINCKNIRVLINVSLVDHQHASPFWGVLWAKIVQEGQERAAYRNEDIQVQLVAPAPSVMDPLPADIMRGIEGGQIHGVLGIGLTHPLNDSHVNLNIPLVAFGGAGYWNVCVVDDDTIAQAVRRLAQSGCRQIGYWRRMHLARLESDIVTEARDSELFIQALAEYGLTYFPTLHHLGALAVSEISGDKLAAVRESNPSSYQRQGIQAALSTFQDKNTIRPDGLVIEDDMLASGALSAMHLLRIRPGEDIKIAAQANIGSPMLVGYENCLLLWHVDPSEIAKQMFSVLDILMDGHIPDKQTVYVGKHFSDP